MRRQSAHGMQRAVERLRIGDVFHGGQQAVGQLLDLRQQRCAARTNARVEHNTRAAGRRRSLQRERARGWFVCAMLCYEECAYRIAKAAQAAEQQREQCSIVEYLWQSQNAFGKLLHNTISTSNQRSCWKHAKSRKQ
jgi:hypothetical protein